MLRIGRSSDASRRHTPGKHGRHRRARRLVRRPATAATAQIVPAKPWSIGRVATLRATMSIAPITAQLRDVSVDPTTVFGRLPEHVLCEQDVSATYDLIARMNSLDAGVALILESDKEPTSSVRYSIVVLTSATASLTQPWDLRRTMVLGSPS